MKLSASAMNTFNKCGYQYFLKYIRGVEEPISPYRFLQGHIVGEAVQKLAAEVCATRKFPADIPGTVASVYEERFNEAGVPYPLTEQIKLLLADPSPHVFNTVDEMSVLINDGGKYHFTWQGPLKKMPKEGYSTNKKRLGMMVVQTLEDITAHFDRYWDVYLVDDVKAEVRIDHDFGNGVVSPGYFDLLLFGGAHPGEVRCFEFKYSTADYTADYLSHDTQAHIYFRAVRSIHPDARLFFCNLADTGSELIEVALTDEHLSAFDRKLAVVKQAIEHQIYIPACGAGAYDTQAKLCGYRGNGCEYGGCA